MTDRTTLDRRTMLRTIAGTTAVGLVAGCTADDDTDASGDKPDFDGWLADTDNYDGVVDETDTNTVTVAVGAEGNNGAYAFDPAAIRISTGTTVRWEWTGNGGSHNVVASDGSFESKLSNSADTTFEHEFTDAGTFKYSCEPHISMGMKGVVVVE